MYIYLYTCGYSREGLKVVTMKVIGDKKPVVPGRDRFKWPIRVHTLLLVCPRLQLRRGGGAVGVEHMRLHGVRTGVGGWRLPVAALQGGRQGHGEVVGEVDDQGDWQQLSWAQP